MILGVTYYNLHDAVKAAQLRTKGTDNTLYIYSKPSINGLFVDWIVSGLKYSNIKPVITVKAGEEE